jgi:hypothetical protein
LATLFFSISAISGIIITSFVLRYLQDQGKLNTHMRALVLAIGIGLTWMISFFITFLAPSVQINSSLIIFGTVLPIITAFMTYIAVKFILNVKSKK